MLCNIFSLLPHNQHSKHFFNNLFSAHYSYPSPTASPALGESHAPRHLSAPITVLLLVKLHCCCIVISDTAGEHRTLSMVPLTARTAAVALAFSVISAWLGDRAASFVIPGRSPATAGDPTARSRVHQGCTPIALRPGVRAATSVRSDILMRCGNQHC